MIPIHPAKFNWLYCFLKSIPTDEVEDLNFDLILLVSNEAEKNKISRAINSTIPKLFNKIKYLDIYEYIETYLEDKELLDRYIKNENKCIVNLKKFIALHWGMKYYDYMAVIDCDAIFNGTTKLLFKQLIHNYDTKKIFMGGHNVINAIIRIQKDSASFFPEKEFQKIMKSTSDFQSYAWFFDVPFYKRNDLIDFYSYVLEKNERDYNFWMKINWESFEHLIYQFYLFLQKDFKFINYNTTCKNVIPEFLSYSELNKIYLKYNYQPAWATFSNVLISPENYNNKSFSLLYHVDRI